MMGAFRRIAFTTFAQRTLMPIYLYIIPFIGTSRPILGHVLVGLADFLLSIRRDVIALIGMC